MGLKMNNKNLVKLILFIFVLFAIPIFSKNADAAVCSITVNSPAAGNKWNGAHDITWTTTGTCTSSFNIFYTSTGAANPSTSLASSVTSPYSWNTISFTDTSNYKIRVEETGNGPKNGDSGIFTIDNTKPTTSDSAGTYPYGTWTNSNVMITLTQSDATSGIASTKYCTDSSNTCNPTTGSTYQSPITISNEGTTYFRYASTDNAGNVQDIVSRQVMIDKNNPTISSSINPEIPNGQNNWYISDVSATFICSDSGSGIASCGPDATLQNDGSSQSVTGTAVDNAGKSTQTIVSNINIDKNAPTTSLEFGNPFYEAENNYATSSTLLTLNAEDSTSGVQSTFYKIDNDNPLTYDGPFTLDELSEGQHTIKYWSVDNAGNTEEEKSSAITVDNSAPTTSAEADAVNGQNGWYVGNAELEPQIHLSCTDSSSGASNINYKWDSWETFATIESNSADVDIDLSGIHDLSFYCVDNLGNQESTQVLQGIKYDDDTPWTSYNLEGTEGNNGWFISDVNITLTCNDSTSGCELNNNPETVFASVDGSEFTEVTEPITLTEGNHEIQYYSQDVSGNNEETQTKEINIDKTVPNVNAGADKITNEEFTQDATASDTTSGIASYSWTQTSGPGTITFGTPETEDTTVSADEDGVYVIRLTAADNAGNEMYEEAKVIIGTASYNPTDNLVLSFANLPSGTHNINVQENNNTETSTSGFNVGGKFFDITSDLTNGEFNATLTFHYDDVNNDGIVDGTTINENDLNVYYYGGTSWILVQNPARDTTLNKITITIDHFTIFSLFAVAPQTSGDTSTGAGGGGGGTFIPSTTPIALTNIPFAYPDCNTDIDCSLGETCRYKIGEYYKQCIPSNQQINTEQETTPAETTNTVPSENEITTGATGNVVLNAINTNTGKTILTAIGVLILVLFAYLAFFKKK